MVAADKVQKVFRREDSYATKICRRHTSFCRLISIPDCEKYEDFNVNLENKIAGYKNIYCHLYDKSFQKRSWKR